MSKYEPEINLKSVTFVLTSVLTTRS